MSEKNVIQFRPLNTKISTPAYTQHSLKRPRLEFPNSPALKLIGIIAAAGYGKSTLMAQWKSELEANHIRCAWLNLEEEENDFSNFFRYLVHSFYQIDSKACHEAVLTLEAGALTNPKTIWQSVVHHLGQTQKNYVLFLDDFHKITHRDTLAFTEWIIRHLPKNVKIVVASRPKLKLNINRLKSYGEVQILDYQDLQFNLQETESFLNSFHHFALETDQVKSIYKNSEGWVLVLQMISILAKRHPDFNQVIQEFSGEHEEIGNYLSEVILDSVDLKLKEFIYKISVLDRFCLPLADSILGIKNSRHYLKQIQELNLFLIPLDPHCRWFRFHHLFGEFLREILRQEHPGLETELQRKASHWFESQRLFSEAIEYALRAEDFDNAGRLIAGYPEIVENKGDTSTLLQWMQRLPKKYKIKYNSIWPNLIGSYYVTHNLKKAEEELELFRHSAQSAFVKKEISEQTFKELQDTIHFLSFDTDIFNFKIQKLRDSIFDFDKLPKTDFRKVLFNLDISSTALYTHEHKLGSKYVERSLEMCLEIKSYYIYSWVICTITAHYVCRGKIQEAIQIIREGLPLIQEELGEHSYPTLMVALHLAECLYLQGHDEEAWRYLTLPFNYIENWGIHTNVISCLTSYTWLCIRQNDFVKALSYVQFGKKIGKKRKHYFLLTYFKHLEIEVLLLENDLNSAEKIFETFQENLISKTEDRYLRASQEELQFLAKVKLAIHQKKARPYLLKLRQYSEKLQESDQILNLIHNLILQSLIHHQHQESQEAVRILAEAIRLAAPSEIVFPFWQYRFYLKRFFEEALQLLKSKTRIKINASYQSRLLEPMKSQGSQPDSNELSERELEILNILESGKNNKELAKQLFISVPTLKWHLYNLFKKFKVKNRTGLIVRAKQMGFISSM